MKWDKESKTSKLALVTVCNGCYYGGGFHVNPTGKCDDGMLDIYVSYATNRRTLTKYLLKILKAKHEELDIVEHIKTKKFTIITDTEIDGNLDGEILKAKKFEMSVIPKALAFYNNKELIKKINKELGK